MPEPTELQQTATDILVAYVQAVVAAQDTKDLVLGGLEELGIHTWEDSEFVTELADAIDAAKLTITVTWEVAE